MKPKSSILINTYNEEKNIRGCLECVKWADEIVIVDMYSTDRTLEIAREYTDKIVMHENVGYCELARQFGIDHASNEWVFIVDADEYVPLALRKRIEQLIAEDRYDVIVIPRRTYFFGHRWEGFGCGPLQDMLPRLFRKSVIRWPAVVHALPEIPHTARTLRLRDDSCSIEHHSWVDVDSFLSRLVYLASVEARDAVVVKRHLSVIGLICQILKSFTWRWIYKKGYKDGIQGLAVSAIMANYCAMVALNQHVMQKYGDNPELAVRNEYQDLVAQIASEHVAADAASLGTLN